MYKQQKIKTFRFVNLNIFSDHCITNFAFIFDTIIKNDSNSFYYTDCGVISQK